MNLLKLYNISRHVHRYIRLQNIINFKSRKFLINNIPKFFCATMGGTIIIDPGTDNKNKLQNYESLLKENFSTMEVKLADVIETLRIAIVITSEKYRTCVEKQLNLVEKGEPSNDPHWDELMKLRNEAADLKKLFENYKGIVQHLRQTAFGLALCTSLINEKEDNKYVCNDFFDLERICQEEAEENKRFDDMLLETTAKNIAESQELKKEHAKKHKKSKK